MSRAIVYCIDGTCGDAVRRVAGRLDGLLPDGAALVHAPRLDLEMADGLDDGDLLVFFRATLGGDEAGVTTRGVEAEPHGEFGRPLSPGHLLEIAWSLSSARPTAWQVTLALPASAEDGAPPETVVDEAVAAVCRLLG